MSKEKSLTAASNTRCNKEGEPQGYRFNSLETVEGSVLVAIGCLRHNATKGHSVVGSVTAWMWSWTVL